ncbi:MAG: pentapeptide repeat-containing protein [Gammaproteobacteria bacterium]
MPTSHEQQQLEIQQAHKLKHQKQQLQERLEALKPLLEEAKQLDKELGTYFNTKTGLSDLKLEVAKNNIGIIESLKDRANALKQHYADLPPGHWPNETAQAACEKFAACTESLNWVITYISQDLSEVWSSFLKQDGSSSHRSNIIDPIWNFKNALEKEQKAITDWLANPTAEIPSQSKSAPASAPSTAESPFSLLSSLPNDISFLLFQEFLGESNFKDLDSLIQEFLGENNFKDLASLSKINRDYQQRFRSFIGIVLGHTASAKFSLNVLEKLSKEAANNVKEFASYSNKIQKFGDWLNAKGIVQIWKTQKEDASQLAYARLTNNIHTVDWKNEIKPLLDRGNSLWPEVEKSVRKTAYLISLVPNSGFQISHDDTHININFNMQGASGSAWKKTLCFQSFYKGHWTALTFVNSHLDGAVLAGANFQNVILNGVFRWINLRHAHLSGARLNGNFSHIDMREADLTNTNLQNVKLIRVNLSGANLQGANLQGANLQGVNLQGANLQEANLQEVNLQEADLKNTNLDGANITNADFRNANYEVLGNKILVAQIEEQNLMHSIKFYMEIIEKAPSLKALMDLKNGELSHAVNIQPKGLEIINKELRNKTREIGHLPRAIDPEIAYKKIIPRKIILANNKARENEEKLTTLFSHFFNNKNSVPTAKETCADLIEIISNSKFQDSPQPAAEILKILTAVSNRQLDACQALKNVYQIALYAYDHTDNKYNQLCYEDCLTYIERFHPEFSSLSQNKTVSQEEQAEPSASISSSR